MELKEAAALFFALAHPGRLAVLRHLVRRLPDGVRPSEIASALEVRPSTLSAYLAELEREGFVTQHRAGRAVHYRASIGRFEDLARYVIEDTGRNRPIIPPPGTGAVTMTKPYNVLFICTANSARSIIAEAILAREGADRFRAFSCGTRPGEAINPFTRDLLERLGHDLTGISPKSIETFRGPDAPKLDFVFTVCDLAAAEECPPWPGQTVTAHWGLPDPVKATGTEAEKALAFSQTYSAMLRRIQAFVALPFEQLDRIALQDRLDRIAEA
ncbi:MAG: helix-turn-helix domain-containing protein [Gemmobacter sp.]